jgi:hypothetical protein
MSSLLAWMRRPITLRFPVALTTFAPLEHDADSV